MSDLHALRANVAVGVLLPRQTPSIGFGATGTTIALVANLLPTVPIMDAASELTFRGSCRRSRLG